MANFHRGKEFLIQSKIRTSKKREKTSVLHCCCSECSFHLFAHPPVTQEEQQIVSKRALVAPSPLLTPPPHPRARRYEEWRHQLGLCRISCNGPRGPAATLFISRDTCSDSIAKLFRACFYGVSHNHRGIHCKMGYRTDVPV